MHPAATLPLKLSAAAGRTSLSKRSIGLEAAARGQGSPCRYTRITTTTAAAAASETAAANVRASAEQSNNAQNT